MSGLVFHRPIRTQFGIDGSTEEVGRGSDIWIPANDAIQIEVKYSSLTPPSFVSGTGLKYSKSMVDGWTISCHDRYESPKVVLGSFTTPLARKPIFDPLRIQNAALMGLSDVLPHVLIHMLGGKVQIMPEDIMAIEGKGLIQHQVQDPVYYTVELT